MVDRRLQLVARLSINAGNPFDKVLGIVAPDVTLDPLVRDPELGIQKLLQLPLSMLCWLWDGTKTVQLGDRIGELIADVRKVILELNDLLCKLDIRCRHRAGQGGGGNGIASSRQLIDYPTDAPLPCEPHKLSCGPNTLSPKGFG